MKPKTLTPLKSLNKAYQKQKPHRTEFENFKQELALLFNTIEDSESEEYNKNLIRDFLKHTSFDKNNVNTKGRTDLAIYLGNDAKSPIGIIAEIKKPTNKNEMISKSDINFKAMHEVILYYLMERVDNKNDDIKYIIVSNVYEWFIFDAQVFEKIFYKNPQLLKNYNNWKNNKKVSNNTHHFYENIAEEFLKESNEEIEFTYFNLNDYKKYLSKGNSDKKLIPLYKVLNRTHLLKESFVNDSNTLDKKFYLELLHILGLEEIKEGSKKVITRKSESSRESGSLLENTISKLEAKDITSHIANVKRFGETKDEQLNNIALELNIIWINRILFLKLLEAQLVNYHKGDNSYKFLDKHSIAEFDDLHELFHEVLAIQIEKRKKDVRKKFQKIPYLNSSLFEFSNIERNTLDISSLKDRYELSIYSSTVLKKDRDSKKLTGKLSTLDYLLKFLDAYDFSSDSAGDIQEENKNLINASVLGLIFEKINGYKEGSFYTPGFITMYMSREVIRKAVLQKCNEKLDKNYTDFEELKNNIEYSSPEVRDKINKITNDIKICDPAVGSGHFLVSSLNEILSIKSELGILTYLDGSRVHDYKIITENDELIITNVETEELFDYHLNDKGNPIESLQRLQELLFEEKRKIIENCLFGVDINPNSVNICRLRLWIELLKSSFYTKESGYKELETLPNIDINIKQGNSLISKFELDADISSILKTAKWKFEDYKRLVAEYKDSDDKESKRAISKLIDDIKEKISEQLSSTHPLNIKLKKLRKEYYTKFDTIDAFEDDLSDKQKAKKQKEKNKLESKLNSVTKDILEFEEGKLYREAFEWRFEFPEVLDENGKFLGFDVVIGNPPYIGEKDNSNLFEQLKNLLIWTSIYRRRSNTYYFFIKLSGLLLKKSGWMSQIIPREFLTADWADKIRSYFLTDLNPTNLLDFKATKVFEDVGTTSLIVLAEKNQLNTDIRYVIPSAYKLSSGKKLIEYSESKIISKDTIDFSGSSELIPTTTISQNSNNTIDLDELFNVTQGIVTGADKVTKSHIEKGFIQESYYSRGIYVLTSQVDIRVDENDNYQLKINDSWVSLDDNEKTYIKKFVYSNQINEWSIDDSTEYVIYFGNNTKPFNSIYEYLLQFSTILLNRSKANYDEVISLEEFNTFTEADIKSIYSSAGAVQKIMRKGDWFKPLYERTKFNFAEPKILVNTKNIFPFSLSTEEIVSSGGGLGGQNILFLKESNYLNLIKKYSSEIDFLKFVNSFLNSSLNKFKLIRSDYNQLSTSKIKNIKLFRISWDNQEEVNKYKKVVRLSDELIKCENDNTQGYEKIKKEVDKVFYDLYGLSKKEIQSIEEFFE